MLTTMLRAVAAGKEGEGAELDDSGNRSLCSETSCCQRLVVSPS